MYLPSLSISPNSPIMLGMYYKKAVRDQGSIIFHACGAHRVIYTLSTMMSVNIRLPKNALRRIAVSEMSHAKGDHMASPSPRVDSCHCPN